MSETIDPYNVNSMVGSYSVDNSARVLSAHYCRVVLNVLDSMFGISLSGSEAALHSLVHGT